MKSRRHSNSHREQLPRLLLPPQLQLVASLVAWVIPCLEGSSVGGERPHRRPRPAMPQLQQKQHRLLFPVPNAPSVLHLQAQRQRSSSANA